MFGFPISETSPFLQFFTVMVHEKSLSTGIKFFKQNFKLNVRFQRITK